MKQIRFLLLSGILFLLSAISLKAQVYNLSLTMSADKNTAALGDNVKFRVVVHNVAKTTVTGISVSFPLPATANIVNTIPSTGNYNAGTGIWTIGQIDGTSDSVILDMNLTIQSDGVTFATAEISSMDQTDANSIPGNGSLIEDDISSACVSVPMHFNCSETISVLASAPKGFSNYQWYKNGTAISGATLDTLRIVDTGSYNYTAIVPGANCPASLCCPINVLKDACQSLGDLVFNDINNNGIHDTGEPGIPNLSLTLFTVGPDGIKGTSDDSLVSTTTTDVNGKYLFTGLDNGSYYVKFFAPTNMLSSTGNGTYDISGFGAFEPPTVLTNEQDNGSLMAGTNMVMSNVVVITLNANPVNDGDSDANTNLSVDFGLYTPTPTMSLGNLVWNDLNNNGVHDTGENGIANVPVILFDAGPDGKKNTADDVQVAITSTDANGAYLFAGLQAATYFVKITAPTGFVSSTGNGTYDISGAGAFEPSTVGNVNDEDHGTAMTGTSMVMSGLVTLIPNGNPTNDGDSDANTNLTVDFGLYLPTPLSSLGDLVFNDINNNGVHDVGENGIVNVPVILYNVGPDGLKGTGDDIQVATTITDTNGKYLFTGLQAGNYYVKITAPTGFVSSTGNGAYDKSGAGAFEPSTSLTNDQDHGTTMPGTSMIMSGITTIIPGGNPTNDGDNDVNTNLSVDFGLYIPTPTMSLGNLVWNDTNNDGIHQSTETGIANVPVVLYNVGADGTKGTADDTQVATTTTDANGGYLFAGLQSGTYYVKITAPTGLVSSTGNGPYDTTGAGTFEPSTSTTNDQDHGTAMTGTSMVMSNLVTLVPNGNPTNDGDTDANTNLSIDFGLFTPLATASIGDLVFNDANNDGLKQLTESGIANVPVILFNAGPDGIKGTADDTQVVTTTTDANGKYLFTGLQSGTYYVKITEPTGFVSSTGNGAYDLSGAGAYEPSTSTTNNQDHGTTMAGTTMVMSNLINIVAGTTPTVDTTIDFGLYQPTPTMSLGNLVFNDANNDGKANPTEIGVPNVPVVLFNAGPDGVKGNADDVQVATTTTDASGNYLFTGLQAGTYYVKITAPIGMVSSTGNGPTDFSGAGAYEPSTSNNNNEDHGTKMSGTSMVMSGLVALIPNGNPINDGDTDANTNLSIDFGLYTPQALPTLTIGDLVWNDANNDGLFNNNEKGIPNLIIVLYNVGGDGVKGGGDDFVVTNTTTDANGKYSFPGLSEGKYYVKFTAPTGMVSSTGNGAYDVSGAGIFEPPTTYNINNQDNGTTMAGTSMIMSGVINLVLYSQPINDGDNDSNTNLSVDFGLYTPIQGMSLGNLVWNDANNDGIHQTTETGIANVPVVLFNAGTDGVKGTNDDTQVATTTTDANGGYLFTGLQAGTYYVKITSPTGFVSSTGNGAYDTSGAGAYEPSTSNINDQDHGTAMTGTTMVMSGLVTLIPNGNPINDGDTDANTNLSIDFGLYQPISGMTIGNLVFNDTNNDGIHQSTETGIANVPVVLFNAGPDGIKGNADDLQVATTTTDANGGYLFTGLQAGTYYVKITSPTGFVSSTGNGAYDTSGAGAYEPSTSNINDQDHGTAMTGTTMVMSGLVTLVPNGNPINDGDTDANTNLSIDFGLYTPLATASIGDLVFNDANNDGIKQLTETGIANVPVVLFNAGPDGIKGNGDDTQVATTTTYTNGNYLFTGLQTGTYYVKITEPTGFVSSTGGGAYDASGAGAFEPSTSTTNNQDHGTTMTGTTMVMSNLINIVAKTTPVIDSTIDFGLYQPILGASIGDLVFNDANNDGSRQITEPGIANVPVVLFNAGPDGIKGTADDTQVATTTTDTNGNYLFTGLQTGIYYVKITEPTGFVSSTGGGAYDASGAGAFEPSTSTTNNQDHGTTMAGTTMVMSNLINIVAKTTPTIDSTIDFGLYQPISGMTIGNLVWNDTNNNGIHDTNEIGIANVTVVLFNAGPDGIKGTADDTQVATTTTDANDGYLFTGLQAGTYYVKITSPTGFVSSTGNGVYDKSGVGPYEPSTVMTNDQDHGTTMTGTAMVMSNLVTLIPNGNPINDGDTDPNTNLSIDFGLYTPLATASIGDLVWNDSNNDGIKQPTESGVPNVPVIIYTTGLDGIRGTSDDVLVASTTTDANGKYNFPNLQAGNYFVKTVLPTGYASSTGNGPYDVSGAGTFEPSTSTTNNQDHGTTMTGTSMVLSNVITIVPSSVAVNDTTIDFGIYIPTPTMSLGNLVWNDINNNGIHDTNEIGIANVPVVLFNAGADGIKGTADDTQVAAKTTDANGNYLFTGLQAGTYYVKITPPSGLVSSTGNGVTDVTGVGAFEPSTSNVNDQDHGTKMLGSTMVMSGLVTLIPNVNPINDGDTDPNTNLSIDFGLYTPSLPQTFNLGDLVWNDANNNGVFDTGETAIPNVTLTLYSVGPDSIKGTSDDAFMGTKTTDANGKYLFTGLSPDKYYVKFTAPSGLVSSTGDGASDITGSGPFEPSTSTINNQDHGTQMGSMIMSNVVNLVSTDLTIDFGLYKPIIPTCADKLVIGNLIWSDDNNNGVVDAGEKGVPSIKVLLHLVYKNTNGKFIDTIISKTTTDSLGGYYFYCLDTGTYYVSFTVPTGTISSTGNGTTSKNHFGTYEPAPIGTDDNNDKGSAFVGSTIQTDTFSLSNTNNPSLGGKANLNIDFGLYKPKCVTAQPDFIFQAACLNSPVTFTPLATNNVNSWWDLGDGTVRYDSISFSHIYTAPGNYLVRYAVVDSNLCSGVVSHIVTMQPMVWANAGPDKTICQGDSVQLGAQGGTHYNWRAISGQLNGSLNATNIFNPIATPNVTTTYVVAVSNDYACTSYDTVVVNVNAQPIVITPIVPLSTCTGGSIPVTMTIDQPIANYEILGSAGFKDVVVTGATIKFNAILNGAYDNVTVTLAGASGCSVTKTFPIYLAGNPETDFVVIEPFCANNQTTLLFTGDATPGAKLTYNVGTDGTIVYQSPATATLPLGDTTIVVWANWGSKLVKLNVNDGGCQDNKTLSIFVRKSPKTVLANGDTTVCPNTSVQLYGTAGLLTCVYKWTAVEMQSGNPVVLPIDNVAGITVTPIVTTVYTLTITDINGCQSSMSVKITVDTTKPILKGVPADITVECSGNVPTPAIVIATNKGIVINNITFVETKVAGNCPNNYKLVRTWTATNQCGLTSTATQNITVKDTVPPTFANVPQNVTINCGDNVPAVATPTATDDCLGVVTITFAQTTKDSTCIGNKTIVRTWTATDACGNTSTAIQTITVQDKVPPVFANVPAPAIIECSDPLPTAQPTATDACSAVTITSKDSTQIVDACNKIITRTWIATDACGNVSTATQIITIRDTRAPVFNNDVPKALTVSCDANVPTVITPTAIDNCDPSPKITFSEVRDNAGTCLTHITRTWVATDRCGNAATAIQIITIKDTVAPVITPTHVLLAGHASGDTISMSCDNLVVLDSTAVSAVDNCNMAFVKFVDLGRKRGVCSRDGYSILLECSWEATDKCGNKSVYIIYIKIVDNTPPVLSAAPANITVNTETDIPTAAILTATDNCTVNVPVVETEAKVFTGVNCDYVLTRTWTATDSCGNIATKVQQILVHKNIAVKAVPFAETCVRNDGSITVIPTNGTSYLWSDGGTGATRLNLKAGTYTVTATFGGCVKTITTTIADSCTNPCVTPVATAQATAATCGASNGSVTINVDNVANYTYSWSANTPAGTGNTRNGLAAGNYSVTVSRANLPSCSTVVTFNVGNNTTNCCTSVVAIARVTDATCSGANGSVIIVTDSSNHNYVWSANTPAGTGNIRNGLAAGNYSVTVSRANLATCSTVVNFNIGNNTSNCCTNFIAQTTIVKTISDCSSKADVCLEIPVNAISTYTITDNGASYTNGFGTCNAGSTLHLAAGEHNLIFTTPAGCKDTLGVKVVCVVQNPPIVVQHNV